MPRLWLVSDMRNDAVLDAAIAHLPPGSGVIFRHYHLDEIERRARFGQVRALCRRHRHVLVMAGSAAKARLWRADGHYGPPEGSPRGPGLYLATVHNLREIARAKAADAVLLSPVFATRSHADAKPLGRLRFALLARHAVPPVLALGGITRHRARRLPGAYGWAAIDGLSA